MNKDDQEEMQSENFLLLNFVLVIMPVKNK